MTRLLQIPEYSEDVEKVISIPLPWEKLSGKTILVTGGTGLIGSFLIDVLHALDVKCHVIVFGRSATKAADRFSEYWETDFLSFFQYDCSDRNQNIQLETSVDFILHLASNTHPISYATDPIGTITANVTALDKLLAFGAEKHVQRFLFASSNEIYGENRGDTELFDEKYCGYIDCNTLRAGYPEAKRCGEALCQAYIHQKGIDCVIARLTRTFGPTTLKDDSKVSSQFFRNALAHENIILKSDGLQYFSFQYVADSVAGLLTVLLKGQSGTAYNIADENGDITLREFAEFLASESGQKVIFDLPDRVEAKGFSKVRKARLNGARLKALGWCPLYDIHQSISRNLKILRQI